MISQNYIRVCIVKSVLSDMHCESKFVLDYKGGLITQCK